MVVNIVLTVPMVLLGSLGVVAATAIGQLVSAVYLLHDVRRSVRHDLPNPLRHVPLLRGAAAAALTFGLEVAIRPYLPVGPVGLLAAGVPALLGLATFAALVFGLRQAARIVTRPRSVISELRNWANLSEDPPAQVSAPSGYQPKHTMVNAPSLPEVPSP
jgi:ABC-type Na+ efflux pump permease subunit